jgi:hypothetical protein
MASFGKYTIQNIKNDAVQQFQLSFSMTTTSVSATIVSNSATFDRAFSATPKIIGWSVDSDGSAGTVGVVPGFALNATAMSVYIRGGSPTTLGDGTRVVTVTLEGGY